MLLHESQKTIARNLKRFRVLCCGRGFGKTSLAIEEIIGVAVAKPNRKIAYIAPTIQQSRDIAWKQLKDRVRGITIKTNESRLEIEVATQHGGTSFIVLRGWESIETLRGQEFDFIVIDEVASMRYFNVGWQEVLLPTLRMSSGPVLFISTPKGFNHFYDLFNTTGENWASFQYTSYDNPHIKPEEIEVAKLTATEDKFAQEYMAEFRKMEGLVYKEFDRMRHIYDNEIIMEKETIVGLDWGYTNPAGVLKIVVDTDNHYWITDEYYKTQKTTEEIIEYARSLGGSKYYPDPAEPDRIDMLRKAGCNVREVSKDIPAGINAVRELFKQGRIHVSSSCKNLINELETYRYPERKPDKNEEERPVKEDDHLMDSLRYALYMHGAQSTRRKAAIFKPGGMSANRMKGSYGGRK